LATFQASQQSLKITVGTKQFPLFLFFRWRGLNYFSPLAHFHKGVAGFPSTWKVSLMTTDMNTRQKFGKECHPAVGPYL
jgi:hypothetical protein